MKKINTTTGVSLIIVTYNASEFIADCLDSVKEQTYTDFETIIVDNASKDKTVELIEEHFPWAIIVKSSENMGFTGGVDLGYSKSSGKYVALLNPDTKADKDWLAHLVIAMEEDVKCGICASLMVQWGTDKVDTAGDGCTLAGKGFKIGHNEPTAMYRESKEVFAACGGAALYRRKMIEEIGFFDLDFFLLHEDTDLGFRARLAGWRCIYVHDAVVEHKVSASIGYKSSLAVYHAVKNSDMVWLKNMPGLLLVITFPEKILNDIALFIYLGIIHLSLKEYFRAKWFVLKNLSIIISKRKIVQSKKSIGSKQIYYMLTSFLSIKFTNRLLANKCYEVKKFLRYIDGGPNK